VDWLTKLFRRKGAAAGDRTLVIAAVTAPRSADDSAAYGDQARPKAWAERVLFSQGVPIDPHLPTIEGEAEVTSAGERQHGLA